MRQPDFVLEKIHRQAESSPIITLANAVRTGASMICQALDNGLEIRNKNKFSIASAMEFSQIICAKNQTRRDINASFRREQQRPIDAIQPTDKIIILRNNKDYLVFNGMLLTISDVLEDGKDFWLANCVDDIGREFKKLPIWKGPFYHLLPKEFQIPRYHTRNSDKERDPSMVLAEFGYCITCHKSQGSEWDRVLVWDEVMPPKFWDMKRWRYTAITRAAKELTYCI
jgi:exodeoxyribonuclease-5